MINLSRCLKWMIINTMILDLFTNHLSVSGSRLPKITVDKYKALSPRKIALSWQTDAKSHRGQVHYVVRYRQKGQQGSSRETSKKEEIILKGLEPTTDYVINVRAVNEKSRGDWSTSVHVKTLSRKKQTESEEDAVIRINEVTDSQATVYFNTTINAESFQEFQIVTKGRNFRKEQITTENKAVITGLDPKMSYAVNVFIATTSGNRYRIGSEKFRTLAAPLEAPRNLRVRAKNDRSITVRWKPLEEVDYYIIQHRTSSHTETEVCSRQVANTTKSLSLKGLLPHTDYMIRITGRISEQHGLFSDWLNVTTDVMDETRDVINAYNVSPNKVLIKWKAGSEESLYGIRIVNLQNQEIQTDMTFVNSNDGVPVDNFLLQDLTADTEYMMTLTFKTTLDLEGNCFHHKVGKFKTTVSDNYVEYNITDSVDAQLRMFLLPDMTYFLTWSSAMYFGAKDHVTIVRIRGEPFLHPVATHIISPEQSYLHLTDIDPGKTYSIDLMVFLYGEGQRPAVFQKIVVMPRYDDDVQQQNYGTSLDVVLPSNKSDVMFEYVTSEILERGEITVHELSGSNITVVSRNNDVTNSTLELPFPDPVAPVIKEKSNVTVTVDTSLDMVCVVRGDYFPNVTWRRVGFQDGVIESSSEKEFMFVSEVRFIGIVPETGFTFLGTRSFLHVKPVTYEHEGMYECEAVNEAGSDSVTFALTVHPKPPGPVRNLRAISMSPFQVVCQWEEPIIDTRDTRALPRVYNVLYTDEYEYPEAEFNVTETRAVLKNLQPMSFYYVYVSAYNSIEEGIKSHVAVRTKPIPKLGPPLDVAIQTLNGTTMTISWLPPITVQSQQIILRGYIFSHRKYDTYETEEMQIGRTFTNVSMIELEPESKYEVKVVALSEDGQISQSDWIEGTTAREAYMNETVPPPPPQNVYLRHAKGNIIVSWLKPNPDDNILVRYYNIDVFHNKTKREAMRVDHKESSVIIYEVEMGMSYQISVRCTNLAGSSGEKWAELYIPLQFVTQDPVKNFHGVPVSSTILELFWDPPETGLYNRFVMSYTLNDDVRPELPGGGNLPSTVGRYIVRSLQPYTDYVFFIAPFWRTQRGTTVNTTVKTLSDKPSAPPTNVTLTTVNSTTILVRCLPPEIGKNGEIVQYRLSFRDKEERDSVVFDADENEELNQYLNGLEPDTIYEMRVRALTVNGSGPWSFWLQTRTNPREPVTPLVPRNLTATATDYTISISWFPPDQPIEDISGYVVGYGRFIPEVYRISVTADQGEYIFKDLDPANMYIVSVRSFNDFGESAAVFELISTT